MTYNKNNLPRYVETAGKITVLTALLGVFIFAVVFLLNIGSNELQKVQAQFDSGVATTSLTVLNTPPEWVLGQEGREEFESSTTSPTNSFSEISWVGTATDANTAPYFMIICSTDTPPIPNASVNIATPNDNLGTAAPDCADGVEWAVSTSTVSGQPARAATTTVEAAPFGQINEWYAWVCDDDPVSPRCTSAFSQGTTASNTSPFYVNPRPTFTTFGNDGPVDPDGTLTFLSTSSDAYTPLDADIFLIVCAADTYDPLTNECGPGDFLASSTAVVKSDASAEFFVAAPRQDDTYAAYGYIFDQFGHSAVGGAHATNVTFDVNNVAPTVLNTNIILNGGLDIILTAPASETTGFTLDFTIRDANSCQAAASAGGGPEITSFVASVYRSGVGSTTCDGSAGPYNPNSCYPSGVPTSVWNLNCTASTTSCTGPTDQDQLFNCSFPLWFIADPTSGTAADTPYSAEDWMAAVAGVDNGSATGTLTEINTGVDLDGLLAIDLQTQDIIYSDLEPGDQMASLTASSTIRAIGNTGLNQLLGGDSMCESYTPGNPCPVSTTSTIPQDQQRYASTSTSYANGFVLAPTSSPALFEIKIPKPTSTSTPITGTTFWGIAVPGTIQVAGLYTGQNLFIGDVSDPIDWD